MTITAYSRLIADPAGGTLYLLGGGHAATPRTDVEVYDVATNRWAALYPTTRVADMTLENMDQITGAWTSTGHPRARHTYDMLAVLPSRELLLLNAFAGGGPYCVPKDAGAAYSLGSTRVAHLDLTTGQWSYSPTAEGFWPYGAAEYDPVSGQVLVITKTDLERYNPVTRTRHRVVSLRNTPLAYSSNLVYFPPTDTFYVLARGGRSLGALTVDRTTWKVTERRVTPTGAPLPTHETGYAYDPRYALIGGAITNGTYYTFDPRTNTTAAHPIPNAPPDLTSLYHLLDYDPASGSVIFLSTKKHVWAYTYTPPPPPPPPVLPPPAPQEVRAVALSPTTVEVHWSAPPDVPVVSYTVLRDGQPVADLTPGSGPYRTTECAPCQHATYTVRLTAQDGQTSAESAPVTVTTPGGRLLQVGPRRTLHTPAQAAALARDGDTVEIDADGTYSGANAAATWTASYLTLKGVGGRAHLQGGTGIGPKAIWVIQGKHTSIEHLEFSGAAVPAKNGAGIRQEGQGLTVKDSHFHHNENGILGGGGPQSHIVLERTEFASNGAGDGQSHNLYIGEVASLTMRGCYSHHARVGHQVKSRAMETRLEYNRFADEAEGDSSYAIDTPNGGVVTLLGNIIHEGPGSSNHGVVAFAAESKRHPTQDLTVQYNTFLSTKPRRVTWLQLGGSPTVRTANNLFIGQGTLVPGAGNLAVPVMQDPWAALVPSATMPGVDAGVADVPAPPHQYVHPHRVQPRPLVGAPDVGAVEWESPK
jgi:hypothetical protein